MINVEINKSNYSFEKNITILEACQLVGIDIPTLCHMKNFIPSGSCRICVVEVDGIRNLVPACAYPISDGMKITTNSERIRLARKTIVELLIANHPNDCLHCHKNLQCELQKLAKDYNAEIKPHYRERKKYLIDASSPAIVRDPNKCIICGRCVRICEETQGVSAIDFTYRGFNTNVLPAFNQDLVNSSCVNCGQCIKVCPTGALSEKSYVKDVIDVLNNRNKVVVAQVAPAVRVALGELYNINEINIAPKLVSALRRVGFSYVFDTNFAADLTIMEEATELVKRLNNRTIPLITSCSPAWIKFVEHFYPQYIPNLSTCKSPQQMMGAITKSYWAKRMNLDPKNIVVVSIMPCTAKKFEAQRPEMEVDGIRDVDYVLTTREVAALLNAFDVDLRICKNEDFDNPLGFASGAGVIFGASGGVTEAAIRTVYKLLTNQELENYNIDSARGFDSIKELSLQLPNGLKLQAVIVSGLGNVHKLFKSLQQNNCKYHFIEVMACPGGCLNGGGQPILSPSDSEKLHQRLNNIYSIDKKHAIRASHNNPYITKLYQEFLQEPNSNIAHKYLHTHYHPRNEPV